MEKKVNILVMGNSGVGKSTIINNVLNFKEGEGARVGNGGGITKEMKVYENDDAGFRLIDTKGLEYGFMSQYQTKRAIDKWSKSSVKTGDDKKCIHIIWYCIDGTSKRIFGQSLKTLKDVAKLWKGVPIIIVITKSYSEIEVTENIAMVNAYLDRDKGSNKLNIKDIVPVVAQQYSINQEIVVPATGMEELIEKTNKIIPEAFKLNKEAMSELQLKIKRANANALVVTTVSGAGAVGAIPIPIADTAILTPLQVGLVTGIIHIYGIEREKETLKDLVNAIVGCGVIGAAAKGIISGLKAVPGINIAAAIVNSVVAAVITLALGEITIIIMEKIYKGEIKPEDLDQIRNIAENEFVTSIGKYTGSLDRLMKGINIKEVLAEIKNTFKKRNS